MICFSSLFSTIKNDKPAYIITKINPFNNKLNQLISVVNLFIPLPTKIINTNNRIILKKVFLKNKTILKSKTFIK